MNGKQIQKGYLRGTGILLFMAFMCLGIFALAIIFKESIPLPMAILFWIAFGAVGLGGLIAVLKNLYSYILAGKILRTGREQKAKVLDFFEDGLPETDEKGKIKYYNVRYEFRDSYGKNRIVRSPQIFTKAAYEILVMTENIDIKTDGKFSVIIQNTEYTAEETEAIKKNYAEKKQTEMEAHKDAIMKMPADEIEIYIGGLNLPYEDMMELEEVASLRNERETEEADEAEEHY